MKKNTYTLAYEACEKLLAESGRIPTIEIIKQIIGINSPNTISAAIKDWKKSLPKTTGIDIKNDAAIPPSVLEAASAIWQQALLQANNNLHEQLEKIQLEQTVLTNKESELFDERIRIHHLSQLNEQNYLNEISILKAKINSLSIDLTKNKERVEYFRSIISDYEKNNASLLTQLSQEREKFNRLENQYNKEHDWALKRIEEEKHICNLKTHNEIERLKSESYRNKKNKELIQAKLDTMSKQVKSYKDKILEFEKRHSDEKSNQSKG